MEAHQRGDTSGDNERSSQRNADDDKLRTREQADFDKRLIEIRHLRDELSRRIGKDPNTDTATHDANVAINLGMLAGSAEDKIAQYLEELADQLK
jgi:hypothetical protein